MAETKSNKVVINRMVPTGNTYKNSLPTAQITVAMPAVKPPKPAAAQTQPASSGKK